MASILAIKLLLLFLSAFAQLSSASDTIHQGELLNLNQTIVSSNEKFELGFFTPAQSKNFYLGIWYKKISVENRTVVWVANREQPLNCATASSSSCFLTISNDGNLVILNGRIRVSVSLILESSSKNTSATLLESGNFVLRDTKSEILWQSFDHPTDTLLPGMKLGFNVKTGMNWSLTSWRSLEDPAPGDFTLVPDDKGSSQFFIIKGSSEKHWTSGEWIGNSFLYVPEMRKHHIFNFSYFSNEDESYFTYSPFNKSITSRFLMDLSGQIKHLAWLTSTQKWTPFCEQPRDQCHVYSYCGAFSTCNPSEMPYCQCLPAFRPQSPREWSQQDWSSGCSRNNSLQCGDRDGFILMANVSLPLNFKSLLGAKSEEECKVACLNNCSCSAYSYTDGCSIWHRDLLNIKPADYSGGDLFLRVSASDALKYGVSRNSTSSSHTKNRFRHSLILALPIPLFILLLISLAYCLWKRKLHQRGNKERSQDLLSFDLNSTRTKATKGELPITNKGASQEAWDVELPFFSLASVSAATNNFSDANKLGQGGFGPVYKGKLLSGQEVAIKRLSTASRQGVTEFKNEITLIAKLQHRNLVRLLGCCIEGEENIMIYEYMPNKSLDLFLFDAAKRGKLDWERRVHIIDGIAQGLLYLHQYSRFRVIHRDMKASNILLDAEMNPKISDFGMARIFGGNMSEANTNRVVGTYGYMPPEYAMQGLFSVKSDVFSFGVLLLEILSGKKNSSFYLSDSKNLIGQAWELWKSEKGLELIDAVLGNSASESKALRYIQVALLCVQEHANDRPTMYDVVSMLSSELKALPPPKEPAFSTWNNDDKNLSPDTLDYSINHVTISTIVGR